MVENLFEANHFCRLCGKEEMREIIDFGDMALTGVFATDGLSVQKAPLQLVRCIACGMTQLGHRFDPSVLYGETYGYESHLNSSMTKHLKSKARTLEATYLSDIQSPIIVDIASNDGTLLSGYINSDAKLIGIDPLIDHVSDHYPKESIKISNFFSKENFFSKSSDKANLVTSLSVLYDLDDPRKFASDIFEILENEGIWHFEQSYLPTMVETLSYDTICHEHLLYFSLTNIQNLLTFSGFQIIDVSLNSINGGSIAVTAIKSKSTVEQSPFVSYLLNQESLNGFDTDEALLAFAEKAKSHKKSLKTLIENYKDNGYKVVGLGASTKGNVLLQWLGLDNTYIKYIGDINPKKFNAQCPGSGIPIIKESKIFDAADQKTIALVLPWHFRDGIVTGSERYLSKGGKLLFPLPQIQVVGI
jgi:hypothetical protein